MKKLNQSFILLFCLFAAYSGNAQDFRKYLSASMKIFYGSAYDVTMKVKVYSSPLLVNPDYEMVNRYKKSPEGMVVSTPISDQLLTKDYAIAVLHEEKVVFVREARKGWKPEMAFPMDTLVRMAEDNYAWGLNEVTRTAAETIFNFKDPDSDFIFLKYVFSNQTGLMTSVAFQPRIDEEVFGESAEHPPVFVYHFEYKQQPAQSADFNTEKYIIKNKGRISLSDRYKNYKLINHIQ